MAPTDSPTASTAATRPTVDRGTRDAAVARAGNRRRSTSSRRGATSFRSWTRRSRRTARPAGLEALLGGLNPDQLRAVTHGEGPLLVVAGAGTGKTQVITRRIAWLIATRRARPSEILALTFTDKAAEEMAVRVDQLVPYGYTDTAIATFHAFGDGLIREYALELGLPTDVRVLSRAEVVIFLREHLFEFELDAYRPLGDPTRFLAALATLFSRCKDEDIAPADYAAYAEPGRARRGRRARRSRRGDVLVLAAAEQRRQRGEEPGRVAERAIRVELELEQVLAQEDHDLGPGQDAHVGR